MVTKSANKTGVLEIIEFKACKCKKPGDFILHLYALLKSKDERKTPNSPLGFHAAKTAAIS